jgi:hypothetical protein
MVSAITPAVMATGSCFTSSGKIASLVG